MMQIDSQTVLFIGQSSKILNFSSSFDGLPAISAIAVDNNVEIFVSNITTVSCTLRTSAPITGQILVIATRG